MTNENSVIRSWMRALLVGLGVSLALGCSEDASSPLESVGSDRQVLTFPVTVTLNSPSPVAPTAPVIVGSTSVQFRPRSEVVTGITVSMGPGGITSEPDALMNETWSRGTAALNQRVVVRGTLHARTRTMQEGALVTAWDQNPAFDPVSSLSWQVSYPSGTALPITLNSGQSAAPEPGKLGVVTLNSGATLTLKTGTYYLTSLTLNTSSTLKLDQARGPVIVYVTDGLTARGAIVPLSGSAPDLLIAHLGTMPITILEAPFNGAIVAPFTSITLRSVTGVHTGFFYAKDLILDSSAKVRYRAPLALIRAATPPGQRCRELVGTAVPPSEAFRYCSGCTYALDSDRDLVEDCMEDCDFDANKTAPGVCGCGVADGDKDADGVPDCIDECDDDPNNSSRGQCGCLETDPSLPGRAPANTSCIEVGCAQTTPATCGATGICGNRSSCLPASGCKFVQHDRSSYWICPGPLARSAAETSCRAKQMNLVRIDGFKENVFLRKIAKGPFWLGANSLGASGGWRWSTPLTNDGDRFWQGAANGAQQNSLFSFWAPNSPAAQRCAVMQADGRWVDVDCTQALGYVCEYRPPLKPEARPVPIPGKLAPPRPEPQACVPFSASKLPPESDIDGGIAALQADHDEAKLGRYQGAAAVPPPLNFNNCVDLDSASAVGNGDPGAGCNFTPIPSEPADFTCFEDANCAQFGSNLVCRQVKLVPTCEPTPTSLCAGVSRCGTLTCPKPEPTCEHIEICNPSEDYPTTLDPAETDLTPEPFDPADLFGGALPVTTPAPSYDDPSEGEGKDHSWCFMDAQHDIDEANQPEKEKQGQTSSGKKISFTFDPDLEFEARVNPLSLGETDMYVHARAQLVTRVHLDNFIETTIDKDILSAVADITAERCTIRNDDTEFRVFDHDFVDLIGVPKFDTSDKNRDRIIGSTRWEPYTRQCNQAVGSFITAANRAKKAFRDAQQLLTQYHEAKELGSTLQNLCKTLVATVGSGVSVPGFPDGLNCPTDEPVEVTINRFVDYYQTPGLGQVARLRDAVQELSKVTAFLTEGWTHRIPFGRKPKGESRTIAKAQFQIGPVPMLLEIDAYYSYGAAGYFDLGFHFPYNPFSDQSTQRSPVADVKAGVMPFANAGLSAFVGAGRSLGPFSASVGIEGNVTLGNVKAPIFAGVGLGAEVTKDPRPFASDIGPLATSALASFGLENLTHLGPPKSFKFFVWYNYGASLTVEDVLRGDIRGRLRIKFAFFSRTWRKKIISFGGLPRIQLDLLNGKFGTDPGVNTRDDAVTYTTENNQTATANAKIVDGTTDMGLSEARVPLLMLPRLPVPDEEAPPPSAPAQPFETGQVRAMFYDNLCCTNLGDPVQPGKDQCTIGKVRPERFGAVPCCPGLECKIVVDAGSRCFVKDACQPNGGNCETAADCCDDTAACTAERKCVVGGCGGPGAECQGDADCCGGGEGACVITSDSGFGLCNGPT
jgi:hypothetical protein